MYRKKRKFNLARPASNTKIGESRVRKIRTRGGNYKIRALRLDAGNFAWASENVTRKSRVIRVVYNSTSNELVRTNTLVKNCIVEVDASPFRLWYEQHYGVALQKKRTDGKTSVAKKEGETKEGSKPAAKKVVAKKDDKPAVAKKAIEKKVSAKKAAPKKEGSKDKKGEKKEGEKKEEEKKPPKGVILPSGDRATRKTKEVREKLRTRIRQKNRHLENALESQLTTGRIYVCVTSRPGQTGRCDGYVLEGKELEFYLKKLSKKKK